MLKLSNRLLAVCGFVTAGNRVADIGTDHGYLPIYLVQSGRCPGAVAMDIRPGPLERAREHIRAWGLEEQIQTRLSDGLEELRAADADSVVIAGMGGMTAVKILKGAHALLPSFKELILEPQSDIANVRRFLREYGMHIDREDLVLEDGKYYPVLHVVISRQQIPDSPEKGVYEYLKGRIPDPQRLWQVFDQYGQYLICSRHPVLYSLLERDKRVKQGILDSLSDSRDQEKNRMRRQELENSLEDIQILQTLYT